jgi:CubicO group peptidase (beta-lactamase class C family)
MHLPRVLSLAVLMFAAVTITGPARAQVPQLPLHGPPQSTAAPIPLPPPNPASPPQLTPQDVTAFLDGFMPLQLQRDDVAGATISIYQNGQPLLLKGYGYSDFKKKTPVDPTTTTFRPGSISKLFTYVAMMQLVEQGKLNLDANIQQYLDFTLNPGPGDIGNAPITLRNLATHTAGFEEELHDFGSDKSGKLPVDLRTFLIRNQPYRFAAPGKALAYSNYGIALLGYIIQRTSGEAYADYIQRHIFTPLSMVHSTFQQPLPEGFTATLGYLSSTAKPDTGFEGVTEVPAGGLSSTAADMALFGQMLLNHGTLNGAQILQPNSIATLFTPQFTPAPGVSPWDLGFYDEDRNGLRFIGHGGDLLACHSQFWVEPTHNLIFFISYNSANAAKTAREELFRAFVDRYLPGKPNPHPDYLKLSAKDLAPYTGNYLSSRRSDSTKTRLINTSSMKQIEADKDGFLTISISKDFRGQPLHFHPIGNDSFYEETGQTTLHFERDTIGRITGYATPGHSDRTSALQNPSFVNTGLLISILAIALTLLAPLTRVARRIFFRRRPALQPQPGTLRLTFPLKLAALACALVGFGMIALLAHMADVTSFYQIGHLDSWFIMQNILTALALLAIFFAVLSARRTLTRQLRFITKLKFALVTASLIFLGWFMLYFHFLASASHY